MRRALIAPSFSLEDEQTQDALGAARHRGHPAVGDRADLPTTAFAGSAAAGTEISDTDPLMYGFGMSIEQIAQIERVPKGTIKSRLNRAKKKLRKEMEAYGYGE